MPVDENQAWPIRAPVMKMLFSAAFKDRAIRGLEIGVWYGIGSTQIWLEHCAPNSEFYMIDSWTPYASKEDLVDDADGPYKEMDDLSTDAFLSAFLATKRASASRKQDNVKTYLIRGNAASCLNAFSSDYFDFIYIDGDHKYESVVADIRQAKRLIRKDLGVICGDDLDSHPTRARYDLAKMYPTRDFIRKDGEQFHPGVLAAVYEEFGSVNLVNSFWWIVCKNSTYTTEILKPTSS